ncbi:hypothetical protein N9V98_03230 [Luminiphilus sp.]|nr:hypothetical protein [Luminiphilus sp.]
MRRLEAESRAIDENSLFGPLPPAKIFLTHDVDALDKTLQIRLKQSLFELFNVIRFTKAGRFSAAIEAFRRGFRIALSRANYYFLDEVAGIASTTGLDTIFYFHSRKLRRSLKEWLIDPSYYATDERIVNFFRSKSNQGFIFGLHPSFNSWRSVSRLRAEREILQTALRARVTHVRQHWLQFSWEKTPAVQADAGLTHDSTVGFNDRSGFRCGAALVYRPWDVTRNSASKIECIPLVLMDSHLYSYRAMDRIERIASMTAYVREIHAVRGAAAVLWHPHTLASDYAWGEGYGDLINILASQS